MIQGKSGLTLEPARANFSQVKEAYFFGRWFDQRVGETSMVGTITEGSSLFVKFRGPQLVITFHTFKTPTIAAISIDHQPYQRVVTQGRCVVADGLDTNEHYARIVADGIKEDEDLWNGAQGMAIQSITTTDAVPVRPVNRVGWFLGDSITAGIHVNGGVEPDENSYVQSYTNLAAAALKVANIPTAYGYSGLTTTGSGDVPIPIDYLNFAKANQVEYCDKPDFCVLNYGTNDHVDGEKFESAYRKYLVALRKKLPEAPIIMLQPFIGSFASEIKRVAASDQRAFYVSTADWQLTYTDGVHPNAAGSKIAAERLVQALRQILGADFFEI